MLGFLSFYHVAEHWFEEILLDSVAQNVQTVITAPGFSARRKKDLNLIIKTVSKSLKARDDAITLDEVSALQLTLQKYVDIEELLSAVSEFDASLVEHYKTMEVSFSGGSRVNLAGPDEDEIVKNLAQRIYKTRNALVHRKNGTKARFTPFRDDPLIEPELPLLRFVAEQIIVDGCKDALAAAVIDDAGILNSHLLLFIVQREDDLVAG